MIAEAHPVDTLLRGITGEPSPTHADVLGGRRALLRAIATESQPSTRGVSVPSIWWRRATAVLSVAALVVAAVAVAGLLRPQPVTALGDLARVAEQVEAPAISSGEYRYAGSTDVTLEFRAGSELGLDERDTVVYLLPHVRDRWVDEAGSIHEELLTLEPRFFDPDVEAAYYASGVDKADRVGETVVSDFAQESLTVFGVREWPTDTDELLDAMGVYVSSQGNDVDATGPLVELAADLLRWSSATPELRSAVIEALGTLDVEVTERIDVDGLAVAVTFVDVSGIRSRLILEFDEDANLVRERHVWLEDVPALGVPAGTVVLDSQLSPGRVVGSLHRP